MATPQFVDPFIHRQPLGLLPHFGYSASAAMNTQTVIVIVTGLVCQDNKA